MLIFCVNLPPSESTDIGIQKVNAFDDSYTNHRNNVMVILGGDFNVTCIDKNTEFTNTFKSTELSNFVKMHYLCHPYFIIFNLSMNGPVCKG